MRILIPKESMFSTSILMLQEVDKYIQLCYHGGFLFKEIEYGLEEKNLALIDLNEK